MKKVAFVAVLLAVLFVSGRAHTAEPAKLLPGKWEGEYLGTRGERGKVALELTVDGASVKGTWELRLVDEDTPTKPMKGDFEGTVEGETLKLRPASVKGEKAKGPELSATIRDADPFAKQSLMGALTEKPAPGLSAGVWIAWKFAK